MQINPKAEVTSLLLVSDWSHSNKTTFNHYILAIRIELSTNSYFLILLQITCRFFSSVFLQYNCPYLVENKEHTVENHQSKCCGEHDQDCPDIYISPDGVTPVQDWVDVRLMEVVCPVS